MKALFLVVNFLYMSYAEAQESKYRVLKIAELNAIKEQNRTSIRKSYRNKDNGVFVTAFKDGSAILSPPVLGGEEGIFFYDKKDMKAMMKSKVYPVKGTGSFWEIEKTRVLRFNKEIPYYLSKLSTILDYPVEINFDETYLKKVSAVLNNRLALKILNEENLVYAEIYIAELIRIKNDAVWKLFPKYSFNMYYYPEQYKGKSVFNPWGAIAYPLEIFYVFPVDVSNIIKTVGKFHPAPKRQRIDLPK